MQTPISDTQAFYLESVQRAMDFLETHATEPILLEDIAAHAYLSPFHFHRIFKAFTRQTSKQVITRLRLEKAAQLLRYGSLEIVQIALEVGYQNHETFTRAFKSYFQCTPSQYREEARQEIAQKQAFYAERQIGGEELGIAPPQIRSLAEVQLAYLRHEGSYDKVGKTWNKLMFWALRHLQIGRHTSTLGIVHDNPEITDTENIRYDACIVIKKEWRSQGEIRGKTIPGGRYAVFRYKGPYENFYTVYDYVYSICLLEYGYRLRHEPALEWYIQSPPFYPPAQFVTDFFVPIE